MVTTTSTSYLICKFSSGTTDLVLFFFISYLLVQVLKNAQLKDFILVMNVFSLLMTSVSKLSLPLTHLVFLAVTSIQGYFNYCGKLDLKYYIILENLDLFKVTFYFSALVFELHNQ